MGWIRGTRKHESALMRLILRDEALCVPVSARFRDEARGFTLYVNGSEDGAEVRECLLHTAYGLILPILPEGGGDGEELKRKLLDLRPPVHSIMGVGSWVRRIESLMPLSPSASVEYNLMTVTADGILPPATPPQGHGWPGASEAALGGGARREACGGTPPRWATPFSPVIRRALPSDADALFPLQKSYEQEEVVINPQAFNELQCMRLLKKSLREELIFFALKDGLPVSKAGTNARGFGFDQIGGVFTAAAERGKGYAEAVMRVLLTFIFEEKHGACLFVKKKNRAANSLYEKLGFKTIGDYVISYYGI